jgi:hypothetical protein
VFWQANVALAFGVDSILYFHMIHSPSSPGVSGGILTEDGSPVMTMVDARGVAVEGLYPIVSDVNLHFAATRQWLGSMTRSGTYDNTGASRIEKLPTDLPVSIAESTSNRLIIAHFVAHLVDRSAATDAFMVVGQDPTLASRVTIAVAPNTQGWQIRVSNDPGHTGTTLAGPQEFNIAPGDALFVVVE